MSLRSLRDNGDRITLFCAAYLADEGRWCAKSWEPGFDQMIQYFGLDFEISEDRARFLSMFECPKCGAPPHSLTWGINAPFMMQDMRSHNHGPPNPVEMAKLRAEYEHDKAIYETRRSDYEKMHRDTKEAAKAKRKQQRDLESGRDLIGPPNPWKHRKGRWL